MRSRAGATKTTKVTKGHEEFLLPIARPERQGNVRIVEAEQKSALFFVDLRPFVIVVVPAIGVN
jgi:hypothetical protein